MVPDLRPSRPLSTGPTLFLAPSPTEWQGRHFLNEFSPAATSCARAPADEPTTMTAANTKCFIILPIHMVYSPATGARARYAPIRYTQPPGDIPPGCWAG